MNENERRKKNTHYVRVWLYILCTNGFAAAAACCLLLLARISNKWTREESVVVMSHTQCFILASVLCMKWVSVWIYYGRMKRVNAFTHSTLHAFCLNQWGVFFLSTGFCCLLALHILNGNFFIKDLSSSRQIGSSNGNYERACVCVLVLRERRMSKLMSPRAETWRCVYELGNNFCLMNMSKSIIRIKIVHFQNCFLLLVFSHMTRTAKERMIVIQNDSI